jgi:hypothetical protein
MEVGGFGGVLGTVVGLPRQIRIHVVVVPRGSHFYFLYIRFIVIGRNVDRRARRWQQSCRRSLRRRIGSSCTNAMDDRPKKAKHGLFISSI